MAERVVRKVISRKQTIPVQREVNWNDAFTRQLILSLQGSTATFMRDYRSHAWEVYKDLPRPSKSDEAWRRTDLLGLDPTTLHPLDGRLTTMQPPKAFLRGFTPAGRIILSPNGIQRTLTADLEAQGVVFTDLASAERQHPALLERLLGQVVKPEVGKFAALASALAQSGVFVYVPRGVQVNAPLHSLFWGPGSDLAYFSHLLVWIEEGASLTYLHETASPTVPGQAMHAGIVEILVGDGADLRFIELQSWGKHVWNFSHECARLQRDARLDWVHGATGSRLTKNFSTIDLTQPGADGRMTGFYFTDGRQHFDHDTQQNHLAPHTTSDLLFKGVLKGESRSVWQGMIYIAPGAGKTDGYQANHNLLLSPKARADTIPGLEILANDVRCTHGATVSKIDPEQLFFLQARGIPRPQAERLIVEGFFEQIIQRIPLEGLRRRLKKAIDDKL